MDNNINFLELQKYFKSLQIKIVAELEKIDGKKFIKDNWHKDQTQSLRGHGCTQILEQGNLFERAGVGFSFVEGDTLPNSAVTERIHLAGKKFNAIGVSIIIHPFNPFIPTVHFNIRSLVVHNTDDNIPCWWFGGGMDLTPYYGFVEDCIHFHQTSKTALDKFDKSLYPKFKQQCDDYFYLKHRKEARGIGGIFYDNFDELGFENSFLMTKEIGNSFCNAYLPIVERRKNIPFSQCHKNFQLMRRGRYVEFNLIFDRGTLFGLQSGGRTESILMSMPPNVSWEYDFLPNKGSLEEKLYTDFLPPQNWLGL